jgi:hypothetical protein
LLIVDELCTGACLATQTAKQVISGTVVAYTPASACPDICFSSFIVRVNRPKDTQSNYLHVIIGHRIGEFPYRLVESRKMLRFKLSQNEFFRQICDAPLREFVRVVSDSSEVSLKERHNSLNRSARLIRALDASPDEQLEKRTS